MEEINIGYIDFDDTFRLYAIHIINESCIKYYYTENNDNEFKEYKSSKSKKFKYNLSDGFITIEETIELNRLSLLGNVANYIDNELCLYYRQYVDDKGYIRLKTTTLTDQILKDKLIQKLMNDRIKRQYVVRCLMVNPDYKIYFIYKNKNKDDRVFFDSNFESIDFEKEKDKLKKIMYSITDDCKISLYSILTNGDFTKLRYEFNNYIVCGHLNIFAGIENDKQIRDRVIHAFINPSNIKK